MPKNQQRLPPLPVRQSTQSGRENLAKQPTELLARIFIDAGEILTARGVDILSEYAQAVVETRWKKYMADKQDGAQ